MATKPQPTLAYILNLRRELESTYAADDMQITDLRAIRTQTKPIMLDDSQRLTAIETRDATITDEIQRVVATLSLNPPKLTVTPARPGDAGEQNASLRENWTEAVLTEAGHGIHGDTFPLVVDAAVGDGGAWTKVLFRKDTWDGRYRLGRKGPASQSPADVATWQADIEDAKKGAGVPFAWLPVDVRTCYPLWGAGKLMGMLEVTRRPLNEVFRAFRLYEAQDGSYQSQDDGVVPEDLGPPRDVFDPSSQTTAREVYFYEYWDDTYVVYAVEAYMGEPLNGVAQQAPANQRKIAKSFKHGYGRVPYFAAMGYTFGWQQGRKVGWGIGQSKRYLCEYRAFLQTLHAQVAVRDVFRPVGRQLPETAAPQVGEDGQPKPNEVWQPREMVNLLPGETFVALPLPDVGAALLQQIQMVDQQIERMLSPRIASEIGSGMEGAGFAISQVLAEAKVTQQPIAQHVQAMLKEVTDFLWWLVRNKVKETVYVQGDGPGGWLGAGPDDLTATVGRSWEIDPDRPSAALIEHRDLHERMQNKTLGRHEAILRMGDNPDEVDDDIALDEIRALPQYKLMQYQDLFQRLERGDAFKAAAALSVATGALPGEADQSAGAPGTPPAMGNGIVPDMANLAATPGGGGGTAARGPQGPQPVPLQSLGAAQRPVTQQPGAIGT